MIVTNDQLRATTRIVPIRWWTRVGRPLPHRHNFIRWDSSIILRILFSTFHSTLAVSIFVLSNIVTLDMFYEHFCGLVFVFLVDVHESAVIEPSFVELELGSFTERAKRMRAAWFVYNPSYVTISEFQHNAGPKLWVHQWALSDASLFESWDPHTYVRRWPVFHYYSIHSYVKIRYFISEYSTIPFYLSLFLTL